MTAVPLQLGSVFGFGSISPAQRSQGQQPQPLTGRIIKKKGRAGQAQPPPSMDRVVDPENDAKTDARSDEGLLDAYLQGERRAFPRLMERYSNELLHFLTRFLGSRAAADDVFQETFLQIHLSADTFDPERRFKPWLFTIAANKARDYHRKHSRGSPVSLSASVDSTGDGEAFVDLMRADIPNPDMPLLDAERSRLVKKVIDSLPLHLREILLLSYFQGFSYNQIADSLEIPLGTVKSRLHTAVASFAKSWKAARTHDEIHGRGDQSSAGRAADERTDGNTP